jgi:LysR family transcriptional regulator, glycine cleavage system transcriptional activator
MNSGRGIRPTTCASRIDTSGRLVDFIADRIDLGLRYGGGRWPGLKATFLLRDAFFPVCAPELLSDAHPLRGPADLRHHALIHDRSMALESTFPTWRTWLQNAGHPEIDCERGLQINDSAAVIQAAMAGSGVALGRTTLVATDLAEGRLVRPFGDDLAYDFAYYIVHRPQADKAPAVAAFKTWLLEEASEKS